MNLKTLLEAAVAENLIIVVEYAGEAEPDYVGQNIADAMEAAEACDEIEVYFLDEDGEGEDQAVGGVLFIPELDEDEQIADAWGWAAKKMGEE